MQVNSLFNIVLSLCCISGGTLAFCNCIGDCFVHVFGSLSGLGTLDAEVLLAAVAVLHHVPCHS